MTIEKLLEITTEEIELMSEKQLLEHLRPWFSITRPSEDKLKHYRTPKKLSANKKYAESRKEANRIAKMAKQLGIEGIEEI
jgi:hypothetical protein